MGLAARPALVQGRTHADREIRYRSERILSIIEELDFQRRLAAFMTGRGGEECGLPGWRAYQALYGGEAEARALFAEMQKAESKVMEAAEAGAEGLGKIVELRCVTLQQTQHMQQVPLGSIAAFLFAAALPDVRLGTQGQAAISNFCYQQGVAEAMNDPAKSKIVRPMLGNWVKRGEGFAAQQNISLAIRFELKEGLVPATKILQAAATQPYLKMNAIMAIAKLGDSSHIPLLEAALTDDARCTKQRVDKVEYETQVRDIALAAILVMSKLDPKEFGFDRFQQPPNQVINISTVGFENDEKRNKVLAKWREYKQRQPKPAP